MYTKEEFVRRARMKHGDKYSYDKVVYLGSRVKVEIVCPIHGSFWQEPAAHLRGRGCPMCSHRMKLTREEFIKRAKEIHGDKYDYSLVVYVNALTKVKIICPKHGVFEQTPAMHLYGQGCPMCGHEQKGAYKRKTQEQFLKEMQEMYGDKYDFSQSQYKGTHDDVVVICKKHGSFLRTPHELLDGRGCPVCTPHSVWNTETFITRAKEIHGDKYSYEKTEYKSIHEKVCITCKEHGDFWIEPNYHINYESGCPICGHEKGWQKLSELKTYTQEQFVKKSREMHGDKYDYSKAVYTGSNDKVCVICPEHGDFWQVAGEHMRGHGCPSCSDSRGEKRIAVWLNNNGIEYERQYKIQNMSLLCSNKNIYADFYLPNDKIIIEFNGKQHYVPVDYFGGEENFERQQYRDEFLSLYCKQVGIKLIEISYTEYDNIEKILKKKIKTKRI